MLILNWNLIISNAITAAISGMFTAIGVYLAMKMIKHAEGNDAKTEKDQKKNEDEKKEGNQNGVSLP
jgi:large-conductance mechanosensitive channel